MYMYIYIYISDFHSCSLSAKRHIERVLNHNLIDVTISCLGGEYRGNCCSCNLKLFHWTPLSAMLQSLLLAKVSLSEILESFLVSDSTCNLFAWWRPWRFALGESFEHVGWHAAAGHPSERGEFQRYAGQLGRVWRGDGVTGCSNTRGICAKCATLVSTTSRCVSRRLFRRGSRALNHNGLR